MTLQFLREQRRTALRSLARCSCGPLLLPTRTTPSAHASTILPPIIQYCSVALSCPRAPIGHRTSIIAIVGTTRRSRSRSIAKPCASHSKPQNRPTRARIYGPSHLPSALSREEHVSHHGPPVSVSSRRTTASRPPTRVVQSAIPTAISHAHRPTADANTLRGSLLARSRSVSPRTTWKERQSWTRSARMATRTRYVQEYVTQKRDQRRAEGPGSHHALRALLLCSCCERNFAVTCSHGTRRRLGSGTWSGQAVMRHDGGGAPRSGGEGERQHGEEAPQLLSHICRRRHPPATRCTLSDRIRLRVRHRLVPTAGARP
jgi:hypothetical protein